MFWKIYFWTITVLDIIGFFAGYGNLKASDLNFADLLVVLFMAIEILGLCAFAFKKRFFTEDIWKIVFFLFVASLIISPFGILKPSIAGATSAFGVFIGLLGSLINLYVFYHLGFKKTQFKK